MTSENSTASSVRIGLFDQALQIPTRLHQIYDADLFVIAQHILDDIALGKIQAVGLDKFKRLDATMVTIVPLTIHRVVIVDPAAERLMEAQDALVGELGREFELLLNEDGHIDGIHIGLISD